MKVRFILGRSGTGKTSLCVKEICDNLSQSSSDEPLVLLVPEQATYQAERAVLTDQRISGYHRLRILSFNRLAMHLHSKPGTPAEITPTARQMVIRNIIEKNRNNLTVFGGQTDLEGLSQGLSRIITEFHEADKEPEDLESLAHNLRDRSDSELTGIKFLDLAFIYRQYREFIRDRFVNPDIQLQEACQKVAGADFLRNALLWVDGFASFTIAQLNFLKEMILAARLSRVALCLDPRQIETETGRPSPENNGIFEATEKTYRTLLEICRKNKTPIDTPVILDKVLRFKNSPGLALLEKNIFSFRPGKAASTKDIQIIAAADPRAETRYAARSIARLVMSGRCRYRDIAVIISDPATYRHYIESAFEDYRIPYFLDIRKPLNNHPALQALLAALSAATGGFASEYCLEYVKTGMSPIEKAEADVLENYCIAFGVKPGGWTSEQQWSYSAKTFKQADETEIDAIRKKALAPVIEFHNSLRSRTGEQGIAAADFVNSVFDFIKRSGLFEKLTRDVPAREENAQLYEKLVAVLDEIADIFADQRKEPADFAAMLAQALSQLTAAFIPAALDQVLVGTIERSRHPNVKAVFIVGAAQKHFPNSISFDNLLTDDDRQAANKADFEIDEGIDRQLRERQYLAYIAFTRPSEKLYITYPKTDRSGMPSAPSQFIENVKELFEKMDEQFASGSDIEPQGIVNQIELGDYLADVLGKDSTAEPLAKAAAGGILEKFLDEPFFAISATVKSALRYQNKSEVAEQVSEKIFDKPPVFSSSRISSFNNCPYQHFCKYILSLEERKVLSFEPVDIGTLYHSVLEKLYYRLKEKGLHFGSADENLLRKLTGEVLAYIIEHDPEAAGFASRDEHSLWLITTTVQEMLEEAVTAYSEIARAGKLVQSGAEIKFGPKENVNCSVTTPLGKKIDLFGFIDRLDIAETDGKNIAFVFDYKRTSRSLSWQGLYHGIDVQPVMYLLAVRGASINGKKIGEPAGAFYLPVEVRPKTKEIDQIEKAAEKFTHKARGLFNGEYYELLDSEIKAGWSRYYSFSFTQNSGQYGYYKAGASVKPRDFQIILKYAEKIIGTTADEILSVKTDIRPYRSCLKTACSFCPFRPVCRFDWQINEYNNAPAMTKEQVLEAAGEKDRGQSDG